jgi:hypothetical protein
MKKLFYFLLFVFPVVGFAQQSWYKTSQVDSLWKNVGNAGFSAGAVGNTSLTFNFSDSLPYVAFCDWAGTYGGAATVMKFDGVDWVNVGNEGFSAGGVNYTSLAFSPSDWMPYVAYSDYAATISGAVTVMKFNGTNWVNVGNSGFSAGNANFVNLAFSPTNNQPYVAYLDWGNSNKATVMRFDGTNWVNVGLPGFSAGSAFYTSLAFSSIDSMPYVAYKDYGNSQKATVMKFNGTTWVNVGNAGFSPGEVNYTSLAFSSNGKPYVAYQDDADSSKASVMKFDGNNWDYVGSEGFSRSGTGYTSLAISPYGELCLAYQDVAYNDYATMMKFDGTNWVNVGNAGFSAGGIAGTSLAFSPDGKPYVAYMDDGNSDKATVMKYDSLFVGINEIQKAKFSLYPNPATDKITVELKGAILDGNLSIVNIEGQQLITRQITQAKTVIDISNLHSGIYFVRLTNDKTVEVGKVIKN